MINSDTIVTKERNDLLQLSAFVYQHSLRSNVLISHPKAARIVSSWQFCFFFCRLCRYCSLHQIYFEMGETWNSVAGFFSKLAASNSHNKRRGIEKWQTRWWSRGYDCVNVFSTVTVKKWVRGGALSVTVIKKTPRLSVKNLSNSLGECSWDQLLMNWTKTFSNFVLRQTSYHIWFTDLPQIGYQFAISRTSIPFFSWCCFFFFLNLLLYVKTRHFLIYTLMKVQTFIIQLRKFISLSPPPLFRLLLKEKKKSGWWRKW